MSLLFGGGEALELVCIFHCSLIHFFFLGGGGIFFGEFKTSVYIQFL